MCSWPAKLRGYPQGYDHLWITLEFCEINHMDQFGHIVTNHRQCQWHLLYLQLIKQTKGKKWLII
jgi:hypothetical protein